MVGDSFRGELSEGINRIFSFLFCMNLHYASVRSRLHSCIGCVHCTVVIEPKSERKLSAIPYLLLSSYAETASPAAAGFPPKA